MRRLSILTLLLIAVLGTAALAGAQADSKTAIPWDQAAHVRFALFTADPRIVDVYLDGELTDAKGVEYGDVTEWMAVPGGNHALALTDAGASIEEPLFGPVDLALNPVTWTTVVIGGTASDSSLQIFQVQEDTDDLLAGTARVTFFNGIDKSDGLDFYRNEVPFTTGIPLGSTFTAPQDVDTYMFQAVTGGQEPEVIAELGDLTMRENRNYLVAAIGTPGTTGDTEPRIVIAETGLADFLVGTGRMDAPGTVVQAIAAENLTGDFGAALQAAGMVEELEGEGPFTVFVPAEFSLEDLGTKSREEIRAWVGHHVIQGELLSHDLGAGGAFDTLSGGRVQIGVQGNSFGVGNAGVVTTNLPATNGVVHLINAAIEAE